MRRWASIAGLALCAAGLWAHVRAFDFVTDDAYISLRYAENLVRHGALEYNAGERPRVEGYTNFLHTLTLAGLHALGAPLPAAAKALGLLFGAGGLIFAWLLARRGGRPPPGSSAGAAGEGGTRDELLALLAPALLAALPAYACWSSGGLETQMFTCLALAASWLLLADRAAAAGAAFALAAMTRPEGALLFVLAAAADLAATRRPRWRFYAAFAAPYGAYFVWRVAYYGAWLPNTFYVKTAGGAAFARGGRYLGTFARENHLWVAVLLLPLFLLRSRDRPLRPRDRRLWIHAAATVPAWLVYVASVGGDFMALHRFLVPVAPYFALYVVECLRFRPRLAWAAPAALALSAWNAARLDRATLAEFGQRAGVDGVGYLKLFAEDRLRVGRHLATRFPPDTLVSVGGAGALPFASRLRVLDAFGLNDAHVAREVRASGDRPGHQKVAPLSYLLERRVDVACFPPYGQLRRHGYAWTCFDVAVDRRTVPGGKYCCWVKQP